MSELPPPDQITTAEDSTILKPKPAKKTANVSEEDRKRRAEHMRKISLERIERTRLANEEKIVEKEKEILEKADKRVAKLEVQKSAIRKIKEEKGISSSPTSVPAELPKVAKKSKKQVVIELSSESDSDDSESEEDEIIYVQKAKKSSKGKSEKGIVKQKYKAPVQAPPPEQPKPVVKFI